MDLSTLNLLDLILSSQQLCKRGKTQRSLVVGLLDWDNLLRLHRPRETRIYCVFIKVRECVREVSMLGL